MLCLRSISLLGFLSVATALAADDDSKRRVRIGGIVAGVNYTRGPGWFPGAYGPGFYGPGFYRSWWGLYDPFWYSPFIHPGLYSGFGFGPDMGEIKLDAPKDASVYIDGAFAGPVDKLKSIWLEPGIYQLQVTGGSGAEYKKKVYVLSGKTLRLRADLKQAEARP